MYSVYSLNSLMILLSWPTENWMDLSGAHHQSPVHVIAVVFLHTLRNWEESQIQSYTIQVWLYETFIVSASSSSG
jgi:hypothetical protein